MSRLERKWWFVAAVSALAALLCLGLFQAAGFDAFGSWASVALFMLSLAALQRTLSALVWVAVLAVRPDRAK